MEKLGGAPSILDVHNKINELVDAQNAEVPVEVPTKVSDLENDAGYITASVNTLANYYRKSETYTKSEVDGKTPTFTVNANGELVATYPS